MASKRRQRRQQCQGKARHRTIGCAHYAAKMMLRDKGVTVYPYKCSFCPFFHVGHNPALARGRDHIWLRSRPKGH